MGCRGFPWQCVCVCTRAHARTCMRTHACVRACVRAHVRVCVCAADLEGSAEDSVRCVSAHRVGCVVAQPQGGESLGGREGGGRVEGREGEREGGRENRGREGIE